jgi:hypothetical protein
MPHFPQAGDGLEPAEHFLDLLLGALADRIACGSLALHEVAGIVALVRADRGARGDAREALPQTQRILDFGPPMRTSHDRLHHEVVAIVDERTGLVRQNRL